jgi:hypothetical protein
LFKAVEIDENLIEKFLDEREKIAKNEELKKSFRRRKKKPGGGNANVRLCE